jgi:quercetin dioxygenase-like cupin family protein
MKDMDLNEGAAEWLGTRYRQVLGAAETGGAMSIVDTVCPPDSGPPRHIHHDADEVFVMLSGEAVFWMAGQSRVAQAGETVFVPRGTEHTFRVVGDKPSRHLVILTPGGFEGFFFEMARRGLALSGDMEAVAEAGRRFHLEFTGPPLDERPLAGEGAR